MRVYSPLAFGSALAALCLWLSACDAFPAGAQRLAQTRESPVQNELAADGVIHRAEGFEARLIQTESGISLDAPEGGSLTVETGDAVQADLSFRVGPFGGSAPFRSELVDAAGRAVVRFEVLPSDAGYRVSGAWPGTGAARLEAVQDGRVVYDMPLTGGAGEFGVTTDAPTSKHYDDLGRIVYDFAGTGNTPTGGTRFRPAGSAGASLEITDLRLVLDRGLLDGVAAVRLSPPPGTDLTVVRAHVAGHRE